MSKEYQIKLWCKGRLFELMGGVGDNDAKTVLKELLDFIDNDPFAEPAPQAPELSKVERTGKNCKEQPASDDLEKEIQRWAETFKHNPAAMGYKETARHFAEWQKKQMMKDAVSAKITEVYYPTDSCLEVEATLPKNRFEDGDKILIIKEE